MYCQVSQNAAIKADFCFFQASDQAAVSQTISARLGINTSDPKGAELTLTLATVTVGVLASFDYSLLGNTKYT